MRTEREYFSFLSESVPTRPHRAASKVGTGNRKQINAVPTVPTVPTENRQKEPAAWGPGVAAFEAPAASRPDDAGRSLAKSRPGAQAEPAPAEGADGDPSPPAPEAGSEAFPHGVALDGSPRTWTGRIVSLDEWRRLSEWERHGSSGKLWHGLTRHWEPKDEGDK